jgi:glutamate-1-semialdehyde 2,1-aminomutase
MANPLQPESLRRIICEARTIGLDMKSSVFRGEKDIQPLAQRLASFVPEEIFDIHAHLYKASHFAGESPALMKDVDSLVCDDHRRALSRYMPSKNIHGLYFGLPHRSADRVAVNDWISREIVAHGGPLSRALLLTSPDDEPNKVESDLRSGRYCGIKVYHCYARRQDSMNAMLEEYAPEWMWDVLNNTDGVLMLHIVRQDATADLSNQRDLRRLCQRYPRVRVVLAHIGRSFNYRHARRGFGAICDLENLYVDTSAICESDAFRVALKYFGSRRILWGSDFPVSELRGRCVATGDGFFWLHPQVIAREHMPPTPIEMTLVGVESLLCLQEAFEDEGLNEGDTRDVFYNNAIRLLQPHIRGQVKEDKPTGPALWTHARDVISGGTGLLSKRAHMFHSGWPAYYSNARGCTIWDLDGRPFTDFAGGIGSVFLGYGDEDVTRAVRRRLLKGTYCSLITPDEVQLADMLLSLHPWAAQVRYARGGGEAMALAVRIARSFTGRSGVLFCGYHGWHDWYLAANLADDQALDGHLLPGLSPHGVPRELKGTSVPFRYNDLSSFETALAMLRNNLAAVVMEPMRSEMPKDDFLSRVRARCRETGAVFVLDEVTSGLRYGFPGAHSHLGITPDIAVYAKAMGNGFPFAAVVGNADVMKAGEKSFISSSYWTDGVGPAAALAVLQKMQRGNIQKAVWTKGVSFQRSLRETAQRYEALALRVGGMPVSPSISFQHSRLMPLFINGMQKEGFLVNSTLYLMQTHSDALLSRFLERFEHVLMELNHQVASNQLPSTPGAGDQSSGFARLA